MTVSGEERGLWGSQFFSEHPTVPLANVVADLNSDMVGRNWKDTIVAIGKEHSNLGATLNRVAAAHPELRMTPIDDIWPQERFYFRSDHYNFARKGVPILFFFNGTHPDYHQASDSPDKIDAEKEARIVKLVFYLGLEEGGCDDRKGPAVGHRSRGPEQGLGLGQRVGVEAAGHGTAARSSGGVVRAGEAGERVEHDHHVLAEFDLAARVLEHHVGH